MNIKEAKTIRIELIVEKLGYKPSKTSGGDIWYFSPFRQESTPSFKVNTRINTRYDFGLADGGDGIKLIVDLQNTSVRGALQILESGSFVSLANKNIQSVIPIAKKQPLKLLETKVINYYPLKKYLELRRIPAEIYNKYLVEVHYESGNERKYIALGFQNDASDYEIRNKHFKGLVGANKAMTSIDIQKYSSVYIFEGFFDFLAFASRHRGNLPASGYIILNGITLVSEAIERINTLPISTVYLMMDNDTAGHTASQTFKENLRAETIKDESAQYDGYADYSAQWQSMG